ncbi:hypothetical protein D3C87_830370 [compost metagenome]
MRRETLALALAMGISGCFEIGQAVRPAPSPTPRSSASPETPSPSPSTSESPDPSVSSTPRPLPQPFLPLVKRLGGLDRLFLYDARTQDIVEVPEARTGGPILNPFYYEVLGEGRILYNSGGVIDCPEGSGVKVPDITNFGAYVLDIPRRLRTRYSEDDYFLSSVTADGRLFVHLDVTPFPIPQRIAMILKGRFEPFDEEMIVAEMDLEPGILVDVSMAAWGNWVAAVKGPALASSCRFPPPVDGRLYLYDLSNFRLLPVSDLYGLPPVQAASLSPSGRYVVLWSGEQLLLLDRLTGALDSMPLLNQSRGGGKFLKVRFLAGSEEVFYFEFRAPAGRSRILAYHWKSQLLSALAPLNLVDDPADHYLAPPY